jgi:hypothetical protein
LKRREFISLLGGWAPLEVERKPPRHRCRSSAAARKGSTLPGDEFRTGQRRELFFDVPIILVNHISLHGWGNASSIASRSTTAIGRELLSGCLRTYSNPISTICFALTNDLSSGTQILIGSLESRTKGLSRRISQAYKTCTQFFRSAHIDPHVGFKRSGSPRCPCCQEQHSNTG